MERCDCSIIFPILYIICKVWLRDTMLPLRAIDIRSELDIIKQEQIDDGHAEEAAFKASLSLYDRVLNALF